MQTLALCANRYLEIIQETLKFNSCQVSGKQLMTLSETLLMTLSETLLMTLSETLLMNFVDDFV